MNEVVGVLLDVVGITVMFLVLIAPHEAGHFALAKLFGVRVIEFSVGAGTRLWSTTRNGTLYAIRAIPIIGYVRMGGMEAGDFSEPNGFHSKGPLQRIAILAAGPVANFLVAMILVTGVSLTNLNSDPGKVASVIEGSAAASAGLRAGDSIRSVDGKPVTAEGQIQQEEANRKGNPLTLSGIHADGKAFAVSVTPVLTDGNYRIGLYSERVITPLTALQDGVTFPFQAIGIIFQGLGELVIGHIKGGLFGPSGLTGPIGIAATTVGAVSQGASSYVLLVALLSVALGVTNLLPLLALDGGRIVVVLVEWLRRRPFDRNNELNFQRWGLVAIFALAAVIAFLDVQRLATGQFSGVH